MKKLLRTGIVVKSISLPERPQFFSFVEDVLYIDISLTVFFKHACRTIQKIFLTSTSY